MILFSMILNVGTTLWRSFFDQNQPTENIVYNRAPNNETGRDFVGRAALLAGQGLRHTTDRKSGSCALPGFALQFAIFPINSEK